MQWFLVNLFLIAIVAIGGGLLWLVGFLMWHFKLPPDDNPAILMTGCVLSIFATYYVSKWLHFMLQKVNS